MNPASSSSTAASHIIITCSKVADIVVFALLVIFFFGFLAFDYELLGLHKPIIITIPNETEQYFEAIPWIIFGVLVFDIYLKYIIVGRDLKLLFKYHWLDISMTALIPILLPLKLFKAVKTTKFGYKLFQKVKKILTAYFSIFGRKID
jgi:hypothetical protein